jgi:hypothetical protein
MKDTRWLGSDEAWSGSRNRDNRCDESRRMANLCNNRIRLAYPSFEIEGGN